MDLFLLFYRNQKGFEQNGHPPGEVKRRLRGVIIRNDKRAKLLLLTALVLQRTNLMALGRFDTRHATQKKSGNPICNPTTSPTAPSFIVTVLVAMLRATHSDSSGRALYVELLNVIHVIAHCYKQIEE